MIAQNVKAALGANLAKQVETALKGKGKDGKDIDLVVGNDGSFVPADKLEGVRSQATGAETALQQAAEALAALGGSGDPANLAQDAQAAQAKLQQMQAQHQAQMQELQKNMALRQALDGIVHDPEDIMGRLTLTDIELDEQGALITDLEPLLQPIRQAKPYLFAPKQQSQPPSLKGATPANPGPAPQPDTGPALPTSF